MPLILFHQLLPDNNLALQRLCGNLDEHLKLIAEKLNISIHRHGSHFTIKGTLADQAVIALEALYQITQTRELILDDIQMTLIHTQSETTTEHNAYFLRSRKGNISGRTPRQSQYIQALLKHDIVFGMGPAGTGKTYIAVAAAADALEKQLVERIILVRPAVEAGEKLGFLPGDLAQKVDPYLRPLYDALYDLVGVEKVERMLEKGLIEIAPLAYMRGRTLNNAFAILDEAQNTTSEQMKMFLTRIGFGTKAVITGDISQIDLPKHIKSGLVDAHTILQNIDGIHFHTFKSDDVVRHPLVQKIVDAYDEQTEIKNKIDEPK